MHGARNAILMRGGYGLCVCFVDILCSFFPFPRGGVLVMCFSGSKIEFVNVGGEGLLVYYILPAVYFHRGVGVSCMGCCGGCCGCWWAHGVGYVLVVL